MAATSPGFSSVAFLRFLRLGRVVSAGRCAPLHPRPPVDLGDVEGELLAVFRGQGLVEGGGAGRREGRR
ncbi:MAG TPA: hypothetical protein VF206_05225, partial [Rubrobacter sp.]